MTQHIAITPQDARMDELMLHALDRGIDDMENGRVTPHEEAMAQIRQDFERYVALQNS